MHRAASTGQPGVLTEVGLGTYADPRLEGAKMNAVTDDFIELMQIDGNDYLFYPAVHVDVAIIRATTADPHGNLSYEEECSTLGALDQAYAAHNKGGIVIAQVKRLSEGQLPTQDVHVPGILVDAIVVDPDQMQTTQTFYDPALSGETRRDLDDVEPVAFGLEKVIARRAAAELQVNAIVNLGFGISAAIPRVLLEEGHADDVTWVIEQGAVGGFPATGFAFGCALNPEALLQSIDQFTLLQGGGFDVAMLSFLEVSKAGDVNASALPARPHVTAGVGGFNDIITRAPKIVYSGYFTAGKKDIQISDGELKIISDGTIAKFVPEVAQISFSGEMARKRRQEVLYVTERCVIELTEDGLTVIEIAPGIDLEKDVLGKADVRLLVSPDLQLMSADAHNHLGPNYLAVTVKEPVGVVGVITPWNFPLLIVSRNSPFALAVGCTAVIKPSDLTPGTTTRLVQILHDEWVPNGVVNLVQGGGDVGGWLSSHPGTHMTTFTGSTGVGHMVAQAAAKDLKRVEPRTGRQEPASDLP